MYTLHIVKGLKLLIETLIVSCIIAGIVFLILHFNTEESSLYIYAYLSFSALLFLKIFFKKLSDYYRFNYVTPYFSSFGQQIKYEPFKGFLASEIYATRLFYRKSHFVSEDQISGYIKGKRFISSDVYIGDSYKSNLANILGNTHIFSRNLRSQINFEGRVYRIDMKTKVTAPLYIVPSHFSFHYDKIGLKKVEIESINFNKKFDVYAITDLEAFLFLKSVVITRILEVSKYMKSFSIYVDRDYFYVAAHTRKDTFDLSLFRPISFSYKYKFKKELAFIEEVIEIIQK